jgi:uncharacterized radical SAM superfamily Fe-S cluster-containing enzyme
MFSAQETLINRGMSRCDFCFRIIPADIVFREGFSYIIKRCPFDNKRSELLLGKGKMYNIPWDNIPNSWPRYCVDLGQIDVTAQDIVNLKNVPVIEIEIKVGCNSRCSICRVANMASNRRIDITDLREKLNFWKGQKKEVILSCTGEPTIIENLTEVFDIIRASGNYPVIQTNGLKLADKEYLRILKKHGLRHLHFSFDGFNEEIYERIRGGRHEYQLKLQALENLKDEGIKVTMRTTLIKGINDGELASIFKYAGENRFIIDIIIKPFIPWPGEPARQFPPGLDKDSLLSIDEIIDKICAIVRISPEEFRFWDDFKINFCSFMQKYFPAVKLPIFKWNIAYFWRNKGKIAPLLKKEVLQELNVALRNYSLGKVLVLVTRIIAKLILNSGIVLAKREEDFLYGFNIFKVLISERGNITFYHPFDSSLAWDISQRPKIERGNVSFFHPLYPITVVSLESNLEYNN